MLIRYGIIATEQRDESGIGLNPNSVYDWLPKKNANELPALRGNVLTTAVFFQTDNTLKTYSHHGNMTGDIFIAYVQDFLKNNPPALKTIVVIHNPDFHKSAGSNELITKVKTRSKTQLMI
ncbi:transposase [Runella slithyformis]|uniref:transposase n=1 Tax=Runella slithyformis TaxID=106 RepID=UPI00059CBE33|nr:transposase [Runella slithyformis]